MTNEKPQQRVGYPEQKTGGAIIGGAPNPSNVINNYKLNSERYSSIWMGLTTLPLTSTQAPRRHCFSHHRLWYHARLFQPADAPFLAYRL